MNSKTAFVFVIWPLHESEENGLKSPKIIRKQKQ